jgi:hypothetical protein
VRTSTFFKFHFRGAAGSFHEKDPKNNFPTLQLIFTIDLSTNSGQQAEKHGIIKKVPNFTLGEQLGIFF